MPFFANSFWVRQGFALVRSIIEAKPEKAQGWPDYFDNTDGIGPIKRTLFYRHKRSGIMLPFKGQPDPVPIEKKVGLEAHITAIVFGTTKGSRKFWRKQIADEIISSNIIELFGTGLDPNQPDYIDKVVERMALHQRFWKVPYHYVGLLNGDVLYNNDITRYTYHGNGGNQLLIGVSAEAQLPGVERWKAEDGGYGGPKRPKKYHDLDEFFIETNRATVRLATIKSRGEGAPVKYLYAHRQYSGGRIGDPGEGWWKEIGIPLCKELHLERQVTFKHSSGREICREWDPLGRVDYKGNRLAA